MLDFAPIGDQLDLDVRVVMAMASHPISDFDDDSQLLFELSNERLSVGLPSLHFAAWEFPHARIGLRVATSCTQHRARLLDCTSDHPDSHGA